MGTDDLDMIYIWIQIWKQF